MWGRLAQYLFRHLVGVGATKGIVESIQRLNGYVLSPTILSLDHCADTMFEYTK